MPLRDWLHPVDTFSRQVRMHRYGKLEEPFAGWQGGPRGLDARVAAALEDENGDRPAAKRQWAVAERARQAYSQALRRTAAQESAWSRLNPDWHRCQSPHVSSQHHKAQQIEEQLALGTRVTDALLDENQWTGRQPTLTQRGITQQIIAERAATATTVTNHRERREQGDLLQQLQLSRQGVER
jgi:hypothetical protein